MKKVLDTERRQIFMDVCQAVHDFCEVNGIRYFIAYGTLLGSVRHKGFIPWDDDFDIMMPYDDYMRFRELWDNNGRYKFADCLMDKGYTNPFPTIYDSYTYSTVNGYDSYGVCNDIYIIYDCSDDVEELNVLADKIKIQRKIALYLAAFRRKLMMHKLWFSSSFDFSLMNYFVKKTWNLLLRDKNGMNAKLIYGGYKSLEIPFDKTLLEESIMLPFEDRHFRAPKGYEELLRKWYGDYMKLPPEEERHPYHGAVYYWKE